MDHNSLNSDLMLTTASQGRCSNWRNICGFWWLGLCNNFAYVVMLSAAHDILKEQEGNSTLPVPPSTIPPSTIPHFGNSSARYDCNPTSTAAVLLADILPTLLIKLSAPFFIHAVPYGFRVLLCIFTATASFLVVSFSTSVWMSILGVIFASVSSGLGELSFLSLTVYFDRVVLSGWGSGTGGAGVGGALLYSGLTQAGLTPQNTLLTMLLVPAAMAISYYFLLVFPPSFPQWCTGEVGPAVFVGVSSQERRPLIDDDGNEERDEEEHKEQKTSGPLSFTEKLVILKGLLRFIVPLAVIYFAEYFINQGLLELLFFPGIYLSHAEQYRWYQTLYQIGVLVSRSSLFCLKIRWIGILAALQCVNAVLLTLAVYYQFLSSAWIIFAIVLYEGLLGGAAYVNTYYFISKETGDREREFSMAAASVGDSLGISLSGAAALPLHHYFCSL